LVLVVLIFFTALAAVGYRFLPEISKRREQSARLEQLKAAVEQERRTLARNLLEEDLLKHDPEYVALMARDKIDLMKPGETIFRFEAAPTRKAAAQRK
jgi:cell division protein FtsB